jgi:LysR family transcriptional regulator, nitrogen assimilation regulatory protein
MEAAMDLRQLRYFIGVAERGGFGAAASAMNIAQSALSRHIKELEYELGGALLTRTARGVAVTESGKVLLERGRWLLGMVDNIKAEVRERRRALRRFSIRPSLVSLPNAIRACSSSSGRH